jgi:hypothetical protein
VGLNGSSRCTRIPLPFPSFYCLLLQTIPPPLLDSPFPFLFFPIPCFPLFYPFLLSHRCLLSCRCSCLLFRRVPPARALLFLSSFEFDSFLFPCFQSDALSLSLHPVSRKLSSQMRSCMTCSSTQTRKTPVELLSP